jgi:hypothetical protein
MVIGYWFEPTSFPAVPLTVLIVTQEYSANWVTDMFGSHNNDTSISPGPGAQVQVIEYKKLHGGLPSDGVRDRDANSCKVGNRARCTWSHQCHIPVGLRDRTWYHARIWYRYLTVPSAVPEIDDNCVAIVDRETQITVYNEKRLYFSWNATAQKPAYESLTQLHRQRKQRTNRIRTQCQLLPWQRGDTILQVSIDFGQTINISDISICTYYGYHLTYNSFHFFVPTEVCSARFFYVGLLSTTTSMWSMFNTIFFMWPC